MTCPCPSWSVLLRRMVMRRPSAVSSMSSTLIATSSERRKAPAKPMSSRARFYWVKLSSVRSLSSPPTTAEIPNRFRGEWIDAGDDPMKMKVTADGILFGSPPAACKFTNIKVANEDGAAYEVNWHCPDSVEGVEIKMVLRLMKVWGKEVLVLVNAEEPTVVSIYQRAH